MFTNQITEAIYKLYSISACPNKGTDHNYYEVQNVKKCHDGGMCVSLTLHILSCSYEDALKKIAYIPYIQQFTIEKSGEIINGNTKVHYWIVFDIPCIEIKGLNGFVYGDLKGFDVDLLYNGETTNMLIEKEQQET